MSKFTYGSIPRVSFNRNRFEYSQEHIDTTNVGTLEPAFCQELYPGESYRVSAKCLSRTTSSYIKSPILRMFKDIDFVSVPLRLCWSHFEEFMGANKKTAWANLETYVVPQLKPPSDWSSITPKQWAHTVANKLGMPYGSKHPISLLPLRAFALIWDNWYRDQNVQDPMLVDIGDSDLVANVDPWSPTNYVGLLPKVNRFHDRFTSSLPSPQKGIAPEIKFNLASDAPIYALDKDIPAEGVDNLSPMKFSPLMGTPSLNSVYDLRLSNVSQPSVYDLFMVGKQGVGTGADLSLTPNNLWLRSEGVELSSGVSINDLRFMFATQKLLERAARGGTRMKEILQAQWGVTSPDSRLQIPEFLGGKRTPMTHFQVPQTSASQSNSQQANISAFGHTISSGRCSKSFVEWGYLFGLSCIRHYHLYQQGIEKYLQRKTYYDFFNPAFSCIGEQPVMQSELYAMADNSNDNVFGYQEAWSELRSRQNIVTGEASSLVPSGQDIWQVGDLYTNAPVLSEQFIQETPVFLDRVLAVPSSSQDQFIEDYNFALDSIKELPLFSVPSLIDHY